MDPNNKNLIIVIFLVAILLIYYREELSTNAIRFYTQKHPPSSTPDSRPVAVRDELELVLEKASMAEKMVIIAIINKAYVEPSGDEYPSMLDLFLEGFWVGEGTRPLLRHLLVVSMDATAHERCLFRRLNCYLLAAEGGGGSGGDLAGEKLYMSEEFIQMMWRRTAFLIDVLKRGYSFIFTDADVIWLRDPVARLTTNGTFDLQISTDNFTGDPFSTKNLINTGFYMIRASTKTVSFYQRWYDLRTSTAGMKEQDVLQMMITAGEPREFNITVKFLDTEYFSGFCSDSHDVGSVVTVHANCCRTIRAKVVDLKGVLRDWKNVSGTNGGSDFQWSPHAACNNSW